MAVPKGYQPVGPKHKTLAEAQKEAKAAKKKYGGSYIARPVTGKNVLYYQVYWKRSR